MTMQTISAATIANVLLAAVFCFNADSVFADPPGTTDANLQLDDPVIAFEKIPEVFRTAAFLRGTAAFPNGGHFQGIQSYFDATQNRRICFLSHDSGERAYFITVAIDTQPNGIGEIRHLQYLPSDDRLPPLRHPGGMQLIGNYLIVGVEDNQQKCRSQIQFWDVSDPFAPKLREPLTVIRESPTPKVKTAGAVGIVKRADDHLLMVANWDAKTLDFYASNGLPLSNDDCRFHLAMNWESDLAVRDLWIPDSNWGSYQATNLICDRDFNIFLLGYYTDGTAANVIDLFAVDPSQDPQHSVRKLRSRCMNLPDGVKFQYAGGIGVESSTELSCFATERSDQMEMTIGVSP
jgi:hypothetical protein